MCGSSQGRGPLLLPFPQLSSRPPLKPSLEPLAKPSLEPDVTTVAAVTQSEQGEALAIVRFHNDAAGTLAVAEEILALRQEMNAAACCSCDINLRRIVEVWQNGRPVPTVRTATSRTYTRTRHTVSLSAKDRSTYDLQFLSRHHQQELLFQLLCHFERHGRQVRRFPLTAGADTDAEGQAQGQPLPAAWDADSLGMPRAGVFPNCFFDCASGTRCYAASSAVNGSRIGQSTRTLSGSCSTGFEVRRRRISCSL